MPNPTPTWITEALSSWTASKTKLQPGISINKIREAEKALQFTFPQDFIDLYTLLNGFEAGDWNDHMFSLWPLEQILEEHANEDSVDYIGFCDFLVFSHTIGFSKITGHICQNNHSSISITDSFQQCIWMINNGDKAVY